MIDKITKNLKVIKRNGKRVDFDWTKIAVAIKKGFDSIPPKYNNDDEPIKQYSEKDIQTVYQAVIIKIGQDYQQQDKIKIEEIQDIIELVLKKTGYNDVYKSFSEYRERRAQSRKMFMDDKQKHKFLKTIEDLSLKSTTEEETKREVSNLDNATATKTMFQYGSTISKEFAKAYLIKKKFSDAHDEGYIFIHNLDFLAMGTTTCTQIDLERLFKDGFSTGYGHLREPNDIMSYGALATMAIHANQNDQHGGQSIPAFDYYLAPGVLRTYKKQLRQTLQDLLDFAGFAEFVGPKMLEREIQGLKTIAITLEYFERFYKDNEMLKKIFKMALTKAYKKTEKATYQAMEALIHNLNSMHSWVGGQIPSTSINFGTDCSNEGRLIIKSYLLALEAGLGNGEIPKFPISIFKIKSGINYQAKDSNYDLYKLACQVTIKGLPLNFAFLDAPFNQSFYRQKDYRTEIAYFDNQMRVVDNIIDLEKATIPGRGNLSSTSINLVRLGIIHGIATNKQADIKGFFSELDEFMELVKDQLLERFELQCNKKAGNFPFLLGQQIWLDADKLKPGDKLRKTLKHGTMAIGFIGLAECLIALIGKHQGESEEAQKLGLEIITYMRTKCDNFAKKYDLNFTLFATSNEELNNRFISIDQAIFGKLKGITDQENYSDSFHIPKDYKISNSSKIKKEAPYHALTNAGHICNVKIENNTPEEVEKIIKIMNQEGIGYATIKL